MRTVRFENLEVTVRRATVRDGLNSSTISIRVIEGEPDKTAMGFWTTFADLCSQTVSYKGLPFDPTTMHEQDSATCYQAYQEYMQLPKQFGILWREAIEKEDAPAVEEVAPDPNALTAGKLKASKKRTRRSA